MTPPRPLTVGVISLAADYGRLHALWHAIKNQPPVKKIVIGREAGFRKTRWSAGRSFHVLHMERLVEAQHAVLPIEYINFIDAAGTLLDAPI